MARAHRVAAFTAFASVLYFLALFQYVSVPLLDESIAGQLLPVIPWWLLVSFGSYSLGSIGLALYTFRDCPEAFNELMKEISVAKNELRSKGVTV
ncbi:dolichol-phosphate mannosyltransferase subunit 3, partial [Pluteus cervinus]